MLSALQHGVKGNIGWNAIGSIFAEAVQGSKLHVRRPKKVPGCKVCSHAYASFRVLTLYARDAGQEGRARDLNRPAKRGKAD